MNTKPDDSSYLKVLFTREINLLIRKKMIKLRNILLTFESKELCKCLRFKVVIKKENKTKIAKAPYKLIPILPSILSNDKYVLKWFLSILYLFSIKEKFNYFSLHKTQYFSFPVSHTI